MGTGEERRDPEAPIGAPVLPRIDVVKRVSVPSYTDAADIVLRLVRAHDEVELVWIERRSRWLGLRHEVRFGVRGTAWHVQRFWEDVCRALPRDDSLSGGLTTP